MQDDGHRWGFECTYILTYIRPSPECIVAPYEAYAQMAYLARHNIVDAVLTEDSDLIVFGCKHIIYKAQGSG